jgi:hypothetical protein
MVRPRGRQARSSSQDLVVHDGSEDLPRMAIRSGSGHVVSGLAWSVSSRGRLIRRSVGPGQHHLLDAPRV